LFELAKELNKEKVENTEKAQQTASALIQLGSILGILQNDPMSFLQGGQDDDEVAQIEGLIAKRNQARADKDWSAADEARDALNELGVVLEDGPSGTTWRKQ
jgi:cysteinyl-tRNA synthetase